MGVKIIPVSELKDGKYYQGRSQETTVAMWDNMTKHFRYFNHKMSGHVESKIPHIDHVSLWEDCFVPISLIEELDHEIVKEVLNNIGY